MKTVREYVMESVLFFCSVPAKNSISIFRPEAERRKRNKENKKIQFKKNPKDEDKRVK